MTAYADLAPQVRALFPPEVALNYEIHEWRNAASVFHLVHHAEWSELMGVLAGFRLLRSYIETPGGNKSELAAHIDGELAKHGWRETEFMTEVSVDHLSAGALTQAIHEVPTHKVDCYKNRIALEIEWNNKDPFYDRDLNNFRLLFDLRAVDVGVIITRTDGLQAIFRRLGRGSSYGASTTRMSKLLPRIDGGGAGGCPVLVFGIRDTLYTDDQPSHTGQELAAAEPVEDADMRFREDEE